MLNLLTLSIALGGAAMAQTTTSAPTADDLAAAEYSALVALQPYASEEYSVAIVEIASLLALLPSGAVVSSIPSLISEVTPAEITFAAAPLASYISSELSSADAPSTLQAAAPLIAVQLIEGFVPIAESLIAGLYPATLPLTDLPQSFSADEPAILSIFSQVVPDIFLALAPAVTAAHPEIATLLPSAVEAWVLGIPPYETAAASPAAAVTTVAASTSAATLPAAYGTASSVATVVVEPSSAAATPSAYNTASSATSGTTSTILTLSPVSSPSLAVPASYGSAVSNVTVVLSSAASGTVIASIAGVPVPYPSVAANGSVTSVVQPSSGIQHQTTTSSAPIASQTTNAGLKLAIGGKILGFAGVIAGLALL